MSNLYSYFQRIEPKKMAATTTNDESSQQTKPIAKNNNVGSTKKNSTSKKPVVSSRKSLNMSDIYSADSPKSEKRKQSSIIAKDDPDATPNSKSKI